MENSENVWSTSIVVLEDEKIKVISSSLIAGSYEEAIGIAIAFMQGQDDLHIIAFDACNQEFDDLEDMMKDKGWSPPKENQ